MTGETMREAMDHLRTDTDDLTGTTSPEPTDEELTTAVAALAALSSPDAPPRHPPGWWVIGILAAFILLADVGILVAFSAQERQAMAVCQSQNDLRATLTRTFVAQESSVPAERYDADTREFYDQALTDLSPVNCADPDRRQVRQPERMPRELGQPSPVPGPGAAGAAGGAGDQGVSGLVGADGRDGIDGAPGPAGPPGPAGQDGTGADGIDGVDGAPGEVGPQGPPGEPAPTTTTTTTVPCGLLCP